MDHEGNALVVPDKAKLEGVFPRAPKLQSPTTRYSLQKKRSCMRDDYYVTRARQQDK